MSCAGEELYSGVMYDDLLGETFVYTIYRYLDYDTRFMCIAVFDDGAVCLGINEGYQTADLKEPPTEAPEEADTDLFSEEAVFNLFLEKYKNS